MLQMYLQQVDGQRESPAGEATDKDADIQPLKQHVHDQQLEMLQLQQKVQDKEGEIKRQKQQINQMDKQVDEVSSLNRYH